MGCRRSQNQKVSQRLRYSSSRRPASGSSESQPMKGRKIEIQLSCLEALENVSMAVRISDTFCNKIHTASGWESGCAVLLTNYKEKN